MELRIWSKPRRDMANMLGLRTHANVQNLQGGHMRIKYLRTEDIMTNPNAAGKTYPMKRIVGEALEGKLLGQEWSTKIFPSMKDMYDVVKVAKIGDTMDITMRVNGKYMNPEKMEIVDPTTLSPTAGTPAAPQMMPMGVGNKEKERKDSLAIAVSIMGPKKPITDAVDYLIDASGVADLIDDYAKETGPFQFDKEAAKEGIPEANDPPDEEEVKEPTV